MLVLGIAGGVGSGKSAVADQLVGFGAVVLDADRIGHEVLEEDKVKEQLVERWGQEIMDLAGQIKRDVVASIVFATGPESAEELSFLESVVHPRIGRQLESRVRAFRGQAKNEVIVIDAAVMFKAGWDGFCDCLVFVEAEASVRWARCQQRGWSREAYRRREASQASLEMKRERADWVLDNSGTLQELTSQVAEMWQQIIDRQERMDK